MGEGAMKLWERDELNVGKGRETIARRSQEGNKTKKL